MRITREELVAYIYITDRQHVRAVNSVPLAAIGVEDLEEVPAPSGAHD